jgi:hypothetical protein
MDVLWLDLLASVGVLLGLLAFGWWAVALLREARRREAEPLICSGCGSQDASPARHGYPQACASCRRSFRLLGRDAFDL